MALTVAERRALYQGILRRGFDEYVSEGIINALINYFNLVEELIADSGEIALPDGTIPQIVSNAFEASSLTELSDRIMSAKSIQVPNGSIFLGPDIRLSAANRAVNLRNVTTGRTALILSQLYTNQGSEAPFYRSFPAIETIDINLNESEEAPSTVSFPLTTTDNRFIQTFTVRSNTAAPDCRFMIRLGDASGPLIYDSVSHNITGTGADETFTLDNPIILDNATTVTIQAENVEGILGNTQSGIFTPYLRFGVHTFVETLLATYELPVASDSDLTITTANLDTYINRIIVGTATGTTDQTITLPEISTLSANEYAEFTINNGRADTSNIIVTAGGSDTIGGSTTSSIANDDSITLVKPVSGTEWIIAAVTSGGSGTDPDAIHDNVAGEIDAITRKGSPVAADLILIEDSEDSNNKKSITVSALPTGPGGSDPDAIHDNVPAEISAITEKTAPVDADLLLIEDSEDSNNKKRLQIGNLPAGVEAQVPLSVTADLTLDENNYTTYNTRITEFQATGTADQTITLGVLASLPADTAIFYTIVNNRATATASLVINPGTGNTIAGQSSITLELDEAITLVRPLAGTDWLITSDRMDLSNFVDVTASGQFTPITEKTTPISADTLLIEDSADSNSKKRVQVGNLPTGSGGTDPDAIHDNVAGEIDAITRKGSPVGDDLLLIEDSADSNNKKSILISTLPTGPGGSDPDAIHDNVAGEIAAIDEKTAIVGADLVVIEDSEDANNKKRAQVTNLVADANDPEAIHEDVAGEIAAITEKASPVSADLILIEDSADSNNKKRVQIGNLPGGTGSTPQVPLSVTADLTIDENNYTTYNTRTVEFQATGNIDQTITLGTLANLPANTAIFYVLVNSRPTSNAVVVINPSGSDTIAGETSITLASNEAITLTRPLSGTDWLLTSDRMDLSNFVDLTESGQFPPIAAKATPVNADILLIEDSADSNNKKRITVGSITTGDPTPSPITADLRHGLSAESDPALVTFGDLTDVANPTDPITLATGAISAGQYYHIFLENTEDIQTITDTILNNVVYEDGGTDNQFDNQDDVRTEATITYNSYTLGPLIAGVSQSYVVAFS